ncbi:asparagine synthase (glutamine-hydrolyzing) [Enterococcus sp. PF1-24]|uniref:asparagine synthase (glutamine-hydrolyzing) n=1 Tax=unclassified Enterococcus TaxID=2608891 RepID=UPI002475288D|nr:MULTISPECIES: asparagine synthase (glutamine-hydrolyzing) [unclassified Enterococcus]MDH6365214.1 asparagine synthase (glutamine-hydrolyzing) [Enterococcus sp. PFB1-1]MDH6402315.1 asparagine synthase (glutamine-hydrolyzing) [Enterococcus sp. PF1-24]
MCGFVGCMHYNQNTDLKAEIKKMNDRIVHRGPDDEGYYQDQHVTLGFRRLSIIDLEKGGQPLPYDNERYWILFNGEIYNYVEMREELKAEGYSFATHSDTEVILGMYKKYGKDIVNYLRGMFAFVIWDREEETLFGARDHFGIKPFHYAEEDNKFYFASESKSLRAILKEQTFSNEALQQYMTYQFVPDPLTMTTEIKRLVPGHYFIKEKDQPLVIERYFTPAFHPVHTEEKQLTKELRDVLFESVEKHMRSDVTVGSFLSGGIDSSIIVAIAKEFNNDLNTISVGFEREGYSEIDLAKETAVDLGVKNHSSVITAQQFADAFPDFVWDMDEPLADPAAVPQYFLAKEARKICKVALSGEGADELFGGYTIYNEPNSLAVFDKVPSPINSALKQISKIMPEGVKGKSFLERGTTPIEERYVGNAKIFLEDEKKLFMPQYNKQISYMDVTKPFYDDSKNLDPITRMQYIDMNTWLIGDLLTNADRTTMSASLELRTPFVDKEVFKVASKIPSDMRIANNTTKYILRKAAESFVPEPVIFRKKLGFPVPIRHWLQDELYDWAKNIIQTSDTEAWIDKKYVLNLLETHASGKQDVSRKLWTVLTFMVWYNVQLERNPITVGK